MKKNGLTMIEIVVVVAIIAILAIFMAVALDPYKGIKLDAAARKVKADLMYVRNLSLSLAKWHGVSFEVDPSNTYRVYRIQGSAESAIENPSQMGVDFIIDLHDYYSGVKINAVNIGGGNKILFHPLGTPYASKEGSPIAATGEVVVEYQGLTRTVQIMPNTGRMDLQ